MDAVNHILGKQNVKTFDLKLTAGARLILVFPFIFPKRLSGNTCQAMQSGKTLQLMPINQMEKGFLSLD